MPVGAPFSLPVAAFFALLGVLFGAFLLKRTIAGFAQRRRLREALGPVDHLDADIQRYLTRCYVLYAMWRERLDTEELDEAWATIAAQAEALQAERAKEVADAAPLVARMVELEEELESKIAELRARPA